jgi:hypothetical protein
MTLKLNSSIILVAGLALCPAVYADDPPPPSNTITVVAEDATPDDVVNKITLPAKASPTAVEKSKKGLETANAAREVGGNATAAAAREQGREMGQRTAEEARQSNPGAQLREAANDARNDKASEHRPANPGKP